VAGLDHNPRAAADPATGSWLVLSGNPVLSDPPGGSAGRDPARWLLDALAATGWAALERVDGGFGFAWFDARSNRLHLVRDRFGMEPLFYATPGSSLLFASRVRDLRALAGAGDGLSGQGLAEFLTFCFVPGPATLDAGILRVPPGARLAFDPARGALSVERWYRLSFSRAPQSDEAEIRRGFREALERATLRRLEAGVEPGVLLSGGMDSSAVATLVRRAHAGPLYTYSFRCGGASFDESTYARALAAELTTRHTEVEYGEVQALCQRELVAQADVPFCNVGINVGTWLLGQAARTQTSCVLTGDGGDEFWGSHPVYAVQRLARYAEWLPMPRVAYRVVIRALRLVRDSDRKRDFRAVLKRILPPDDVPRALGPYRWLTYFRPADFPALLTPAGLALVKDCDPFQAVIDAYEGYEGPDDNLSPHLYNDYVTASGYYFSRLGLLRGLGVEARCPFYDRELVELGARIPARLKLEGLERTKRLFREAMEGVLPDVINHRRDKLGHSVPLKNWLRQPGPLSRFLEDVLAPSALAARGLFRAEPVATLLREHRERRQNNAHRLWALLTLELWLRARDGRTSGPAAA
jgi:asparagine synthase (glutamine-hydrolysing)